MMTIPTRLSRRCLLLSRHAKHCAAAILIASAAVVLSLGVRAAEPVVIGAMYNLTGGQQDLDIPSSRGARLAIEEANQNGGVLGRPVKLILVDGRTKPKVIAREATKNSCAEAAACRPDRLFRHRHGACGRARCRKK